MGSATLSIWDGDQVRDLKIRWSRGHDVDARVQVPRSLVAEWREAERMVRADNPSGSVRPYPTLPVEVPTSKLATTATGIYAVAVAGWGRRAAWRVAPPYEVGEDPPQEVEP